MTSLVRLAERIAAKYLVAEDEAPDTIRTIEPADMFNQVQDTIKALPAPAPAVPILKFMNILHGLAGLKNKLHPLKDQGATAYHVFNLLVGLRPGVLRNAIKSALESNSLGKTDYADFYNSFVSQANTNRLVDWLLYLANELKTLDGSKHAGLTRDIESLVRELNFLQ